MMASSRSQSSYLIHSIVVITVAVLLFVGDGASVSVPVTIKSSSFSSTEAPSKSDPDMDTLKALTSSRILLDHITLTNSKTSDSDHLVDVYNGNVPFFKYKLKEMEKIVSSETSTSSSLETDSRDEPSEKVLSNLSDSISSSSSTPESYSSLISSTSSYSKTRISLSSPLHVARCRATCLDKFRSIIKDETSSGPASTFGSASATATSTDITNDESKNKDSSDFVQEVNTLPILRSKRRKRSASSTDMKPTYRNKVVSSISTPRSSLYPGPLMENSPEFISCWKNCELLEGQDSSSSSTKSEVSSERQIDDVEFTQKLDVGADKNHKHFTHPCSSEPTCMNGCQVACSFYQELSIQSSTTSMKTVEKNNGAIFYLPTSNAVVAMKHENVVTITPGKIAWPLPPPQISTVFPLVYVVIQEYPDKKWRQIAQTSKTEIEIPTGLSTSTSSKLRSIRVFVVGKDGLICVYNPVKSLPKAGEKVGHGKQHGKSDNSNDKSNNLEKVNESTTSSPEGSTDDVSQRTDSTAITVTATKRLEPSESSTESTPKSTPTATVKSDSSIKRDKTVVEKHIEPRVVSLSHQKSLVICELRWDEIGGNPIQDYLITWELSGGGLKGHLVTDSTSVTLSLWPDTTYTIQVEKFQEKFDGESEPQTFSPSKSLPLTIDTGEASFPMEQPSALLGSDDEKDADADEDDYKNEDVFSPERKMTLYSRQEVGRMSSTHIQNPHKSMSTGFLNMTLLIGISISALLFVLVILIVAAFTWSRMQAFSSRFESSPRHHSNIRNFYSSSLDYSSMESPVITPTKSLKDYYYTEESQIGERCCYDYGPGESERDHNLSSPSYHKKYYSEFISEDFGIEPETLSSSRLNDHNHLGDNLLRFKDSDYEALKITDENECIRVSVISGSSTDLKMSLLSPGNSSHHYQLS